MLLKDHEPLPIHAGRMPHPLVTSDHVSRLRSGVYVFDAAWSGLFVEDRLRVRASAVWASLKNTQCTITHITAAALHGLPLFRLNADRVDVALPAGATRSNGGDIRRHHVPLPHADIATVDGMRVTSLERTVYDVIRSVSLEAAVVVFDAALHKVAWDDKTNTYDEPEAERFRQAVRERVCTHPGARGIRQARFVTEFADGRAGSPGESVSRLWMWELGVPTPELQYRVELRNGRYALLDFAWPHLCKWGEFDGQIKYSDAGILRGRTVDEIMQLQQEREAAVEAATKWKCERWGSPALTDLPDFARAMRAAGLLPGRVT
ncbi:hypothetical protein [Microbacterium sp. KR10-403]|uniref:hypothetical protein n=1 Tax=Microbacterium sp. KR10-403 TaxID=3158581 RepID=UPI0032E3E01A